MKIFMVIIFSVFISADVFGMNIKSIQCGSGVKNRQVVKKSSIFKVGDTVCCLSDVRNIKKNTYIIHRWVFDSGHLDIKLKVKPYARFRTWSCKKIRSAGVWKLEIIDSKDKLLKEKIFVVK